MIVNDTPLNLLVSYAYCGRNKSFLDSLISISKSGRANLMLDSGAFTKHNANMNLKHVNLNDYIDFCGDYAPFFEKYVMLDKVGDEIQSKRNYEEMVRQGLEPMFVVTMFDKQLDYVKDTLNVNPNICVAGGATTKSDWMTKRFQDVYRHCDGECRIHGLAYVTFPKMLQLNLASVDSASWNLQPSKFGILNTFSETGINNVRWVQIFKGAKISPELKRLLEFIKVTPAMFRDKALHRGKGSIENLCSIVANMQMQRYCYRRGLRYFLALGCLSQLQQVEWVLDNWNDLSFEKFRAL